MSELLKQNIKKIIDISNADFEYILSVFERKLIPKKQFILQQGEVCRYFSFCENGCFRNFYVNESGDEIVVDFAIEDYWVGDLFSLINLVPSKYNLQALEKSSVLCATRENFLKICNEIPALKEGYLFKAQRNQNMAVDMLTIEKYAVAEEKYFKLLERFPGIANRVASIHIASYLGITPESFSRLKKKFAGK